MEETAEEIILESERLILRPPTLDDIEVIVALADNPRVAENLATLPSPYTAADALAWIEGDQEADRHPVRFALFDKSDQTFVGAAGLGRAEEGGLEIGYWIGEPFWSNGLATEAARAVIDFGFGQLGLSAIWGRCRIGNHGSRRVLVKCGFQQAGPGMAASRFHGGSVPVDRFLLEHGIWTSLRSLAAKSRRETDDDTDDSDGVMRIAS